jgi:hypothetical protein
MRCGGKSCLAHVLVVERHGAEDCNVPAQSVAHTAPSKFLLAPHQFLDFPREDGTAAELLPAAFLLAAFLSSSFTTPRK